MSIRRIAAQAALVLSLFLIGTIVIWMVVIPGLGMPMTDDLSQFAKFALDHHRVFTFYYFFDWVFAITLFILAAAFTQRFSRRQPWLGTIIGGTGVMCAVLFFAAGSIGILSLPASINEFSLHSNLTTAILAVQMQFAIETAATAMTGILIFSAALASARTKAFSKTINVFGYLTGIFYVVGLPLSAISVSLGYIAFIGVITSIVFNIGVAWSFMKQPHQELTLVVQN